MVMLAGLALVCSDASLAYAHARLGKRRAAGLIGGSPMMPVSAPAVDGSAPGGGYEAAVASARRCTVMYAGAASRLAGAAVPIAIRLAAGQPAIMPELRALAPSDILRAPQRYAPLVQITVGGASGCPGAGVAALNADLASHHRQLRVSIDRLLGSGAPPTVFDTDGHSEDRVVGPDDVGGGFPAALHAYAADCVWTVTLLRELAAAPVG